MGVGDRNPGRVESPGCSPAGIRSGNLGAGGGRPAHQRGRSRLADTVSAPTPSPASRSMPARPVEVAAIDRELTRLWEEAGRGEETPHPVTRACMSNLIILCHSDAEAHTVEEEIGDIVAQHPARVLLLVARE